MTSRMEKYHGDSSGINKRSVRNESLYKDIYNNVEYSNIERVATLEKTNEISLEQIQDLLREREMKKSRSIIQKKESPIVVHKTESDRSYDIRDVLSKAKNEYHEDSRNRSLSDTQCNIFKNININDSDKVYNDDEIEKTLVNTGVLKGYDDKELSLDMLSDLKSTGNTVVNKTSNVLSLKDVKEAKDKYQPKDDDGLDKSFYTSSLNFKDDDFEQLKDLQDSIESNNKLIKVLFFLFALIVLGVIGFIVYKIM